MIVYCFTCWRCSGTAGAIPYYIMAKNTITLRLTRHQARQLYDLLEGLNYNEGKKHGEYGLSFYSVWASVTDWYFPDLTHIERFRSKIMELLDNVLD